MDELEPLGLQRSLSLPISGPKGGTKEANRAGVALGLAADKASQDEESSQESIDEDELLLQIFKLAVWICRRPVAVLAKAEKAALLLHAINNMNSLTKGLRSASSLL